MAEISLETKLVGDITGNFFVPSYQRGYRWGEDEVQRLLDDIEENGNESYYLQPIVVRDRNDSYELIDGQQRLTTLYLIYKYMHNCSPKYSAPKFSLEYETRTNSKEFLLNLDLNLDVNRREENIDFWFIYNAYETVNNWFNSKEDKHKAIEYIFEYFNENVKIIWYEIDNSQEKSTELFTRLNTGKIPLTNAELVKAMFLCMRSAENINTQLDWKEQFEIAGQWDKIEQRLHDDKLWYFLINNNADKDYQTRMDLVLDMMAVEPDGKKDKYSTFFYFDNLRKQKEKDLKELWEDIHTTFSKLVEWFEDLELYHKIGYLIASDTKSLAEVYKLYTQSKTMEDFKEELVNQIQGSIQLKGDRNYGDLSYKNDYDYRIIRKLLLLFNVESVGQQDESTQRFPFDKFNSKEGKKWSLEHIHAQNQEGLKTKEEWEKWLLWHKDSIESLNGDHTGLINKINDSIKEGLGGDTFRQIQDEVFDILSDGSTEYLHTIANLALLDTRANTVLNNSTFAVKHNEIIKMISEGQYIPPCTKDVFQKNYTPSANKQFYSWEQPDRKAYIDAINTVLKAYLPHEGIVLEKEER